MIGTHRHHHPHIVVGLIGGFAVRQRTMIERPSMKAITFLTLLFSVLAGTPILAQVVDEVIAADDAIEAPLADPASLVCLSGDVKEGNGKGRPFVIRVPSNKATEFRSRGFTDTNCGGLSRGTVKQRKTICALATSGNPSVSHSIWEAFGVSALELCRSVDSIKGPQAD